jgi:glucose uptake protein GlcU
MEKDVWLGLLGAIMGVSGLLLVFCGFLFTKAESYESKRGEKFKLLAKAGVIPLFVSFISAWTCTSAVGGNPWAVAHAFLLFKIALVISAAYSIISLLSL